MKTLATCKPTEFLKQTNKARRLAEKWLKDTKFLELRDRKPELKTATPDMTNEERLKIVEENRIRVAEQTRKNLQDILDKVLEEYPEETLSLLAVCCFLEPEEVDNHEVGEYLDAAAELIGNPSVLNFFTSLAMLGQINISALSRQ